MDRQVKIRKVSNGYVVNTVVTRPAAKKNVESMIKLMRSMGVYESWQEHQEEDIRRALQSISGATPPEKTEKEHIFRDIDEVDAFIRNFFADDIAGEDPIYL